MPSEVSSVRPPSFGPIRQVGYVVEDLGVSVAQWLRSTGIGPWVCFRNVVLPGELHGRATTVKMDVALGYQGELEIELIQPTSFELSPYVNSQGRADVGPNHLAWFTDDLDAAVASARRRGLAPVFFGHNPVTRVCYLETPQEPRVRYELIQYSAEGLAGWRDRLRAAADWDGSDPVMEIDLAGLLT
jgi:hypothetical protein